MELRSIQAAGHTPARPEDTAVPAPHARAAEGERERTREHAPQEARNSALPNEEQVRHAGANVGIPPALDQAHPRIRIDERVQQLITQIVDENNVVVRQIPPEEQLRLRQLTSQLQGLLFDKHI